METKGEIRARLLSLRDSLSGTEVREKSRLSTARILALEAVRESDRMVLYSPIRNEVETAALFDRLLGMGKQIGFPRIKKVNEVKEGRLEFLEVTDLKSLSPGRWGICEPKEGRVMRLEEIDLAIVPGVAFDESGSRIGFGGGFYDRALASFRGWKIGLAYDFQVLEEIPQEEGDFRCDAVVTDMRVLSRRDLWNRRPF